MNPDTPEKEKASPDSLRHELVLQPLDAELTPTSATPKTIPTPEPKPTPTNQPPVPAPPPETSGVPRQTATPASPQPGPSLPSGQSDQDKGYANTGAGGGFGSKPEVITVPWLKIGLLGFLAPVAASLIFYVISVALYHLPSHFVDTLIRVGIFQLFTFSLLMATAYLVAQRLEKWSVVYPWTITSGAIGLVITSTILIRHLQRYSFYNLVYSGDIGGVQRAASIISVFLVPLAFMAGLLLFTLIFENLYKLPALARTALMVLVVALPLAVTSLYTPKPANGLISDPSGESPGDVRLPHNSEVGWAIFPSKLPTGMTGLQECDDMTGQYDIRCSFNFPPYPGYLSPQGQQRVDSYIQSLGTPADNLRTPTYPWVEMNETQNDPKNFQPFMYKNGSCDILGLESMMAIAQQYRGPKNIQDIQSRQTSEPRPCVKQTTPGGLTLYMQSTTTDGLKQPFGYYFVKDGVVVTLEHDQLSSAVSTVSTVYYTDSNYKGQFNAFVDSFKKN